MTCEEKSTKGKRGFSSWWVHDLYTFVFVTFPWSFNNFTAALFKSFRVFALSWMLLLFTVIVIPLNWLLLMTPTKRIS